MRMSRVRWDNCCGLTCHNTHVPLRFVYRSCGWFMISPASIKRTKVKKQRTHVRYYEPVGEDQKTCEAWQNNKKCPEAFSERTWDYHPNGDGSLKNCMSICSNIGEAACCYFSEKNKCWSHGLTQSMKLRKNPKVLMFFPVYM